MSALEPVAEQVLGYFVSKQCVTEYVHNLNFLHVACFKMLLSKLLGYAIILGSIVVKFPQIVKIVMAGSAEGISFKAQLLELVAMSTTLAYSIAKSFPFSAYGDSLFLALQTSLIAFFTLFYANKSRDAFIFIFAYSLVTAVMCTTLTPVVVLEALAALNVPFVALGKCLQIFANLQARSTGQLSLVTTVLQFAGAAARVFTSIQETGDQLVVMTYAVASVCNGIILLQIFMYWGAASAEKKKKA